MDDKNLPKKLRERRELLGLSQEYMAEKLNMTQPSYSWIENDKVRFTAKLIDEIKAIKGFEDFDQPAELQQTKSGDKPHSIDVQPGGQTLASRWKWGMPLLYIVVVLGGVLLIDLIFQIGIELYRGFTGETELDQDITALISVIYLVLYVLLIRWAVFREKW